MATKLIIDCPLPPSANRLWRVGRRGGGKPLIYRSPEYERWRSEFYYYQKGVTGREKIDGPFDAEILVSSKRRDVDNNAKALLDICETMGIIENDKLARRVALERVEKDKAPLGCRLTLIPLEKKNEEPKKEIQKRKKKTRPELP